MHDMSIIPISAERDGGGGGKYQAASKNWAAP